MNFQDPLNLASNDANNRDDMVPFINSIPRPEPTKAIVTIKKNPLTVRTVPIPFYLMRELPKPGKITGQTNLLSHYGLEGYYRKMTKKKLMEKLEEFQNTLGPELRIPGYEDKSSLKHLMENPPICGKELRQLSSTAMTAFRLNPGTLPTQYHPVAGSARVGSADREHPSHNQLMGPSQITPLQTGLHPPPTDVVIDSALTNEQLSVELIPKRRKKEHKEHRGKKKKKNNNG